MDARDVPVETLSYPPSAMMADSEVRTMSEVEHQMVDISNALDELEQAMGRHHDTTRVLATRLNRVLASEDQRDSRPEQPPVVPEAVIESDLGRALANIRMRVKTLAFLEQGYADYVTEVGQRVRV